MQYVDIEQLEELKAEYLDDKYIVPQPESLYRLAMPGGGRMYYSIDDKQEKVSYFLSTTTIIHRYHSMDRFLLKWWCEKGWDEARRIMWELSNYGTFMHIVFKDLLLRNYIDISDIGLTERITKYCVIEEININDINLREWIEKAKLDTIGIVKWIQDYQVEPVAIEVTLRSNEWKYAGTLDLVCFAKLDKKSDEKTLILVDYKTGRNNFYDDYSIQLESYLGLWHENYPEMQIEKVFNLGAKNYRIPIGKSVTPYRFQDQTDSMYSDRWYAYLGMYTKEYETLMPKNKTIVKDVSLNLESDLSDLFQEIDITQNILEAANVENQTNDGQSKDADNRTPEDRTKSEKG